MPGPKASAGPDAPKVQIAVIDKEASGHQGQVGRGPIAVDGPRSRL